MNGRAVKLLRKIYGLKRFEKLPKSAKRGWKKLTDYEKGYMRELYEQIPNR